METLVKIKYNDINQFVIDINRNFAVLQNSPLYKGIPGKKIIGDIGPKGIRGSQFLFVSYAQFVNQFPTLTLASQIDLIFINSKLSFLDKQKLLSIFEITEFVNNDIIVLTNSIMLKYNLQSNSFVDTKIAFNAQSNLLSSIETQIQDIITQQLALNPILNTTNTLTTYLTYSTSLQQNNNLPITNPETSVYEPYLNGTVNGELITNHKYYGYPETTFEEGSNGTIVFGSIRRYFNLIEGTINDISSLTSNYAPSINNLPSAVFLQDTSNNGILFGLKTKTDLKTFGSIYKDSDDNIVIKSDSGNLIGDFSKLLISKTRLKYDKYVEFGDYLWLSGNLIADGSISNPYIRTNQYASVNTIEIGSNLSGASQRNVSDNIQLVKFGSKVLVTDSIGTVSKAYSVETTMLPMTKIIHVYTDLYIITGYPLTLNADKRFLTSNYLTFIYDKFNAVIKGLSELSAISTGITSNTYTKADFTNGLVADILCTGLLQTTGSFNLGYLDNSALISGLAEDNLINIGWNEQTTLNINCETNFTNIKNKILCTDNYGKVVSTYNFDDSSIQALFLNNILCVGNHNDGTLISGNFQENTIILGNNQSSNLTIYGSTILTNINNKILQTNIDGKIVGTYDFNDFSIPAISLSNSLNIGILTTPIFKVDYIANTITIGYNAASVLNIHGSILITDIKNKILYTDNAGKIVNTYDFNDFSIPTISLKNALVIGDSFSTSVLNINFSNNLINLGYNSASQTIISGYLKPLANNIKAVMVVGTNNNIATGVEEYSICEAVDTPTIVNDYILDNTFLNSRKETKILNGLQFDWIVKSLNNLRQNNSGIRFLGNISLTINASNQLISTINSIGTNIINGINGVISNKISSGYYETKVYQDSGTAHQILLTKTGYFITYGLIDPKVITVGISDDDNRIICKVSSGIDLSINFPIVLNIFEITTPTFS